MGSQLAAADQYRALSERSETKRVERAQRVEAPTLHVQNLQVRDLPPVSFTAAPGTITLVEGPSGSGKSSLIAALRGAAAFTGTATLAGTDVRNLAPADWLSWAGQSPGLIRGTIADNVTLGSDPEPTAIRHALDAACADDLDPAQELGVQGSGLSGGQAQRVAVARALYRHAARPRTHPRPGRTVERARRRHRTAIVEDPARPRGCRRHDPARLAPPHGA